MLVLTAMLTNADWLAIIGTAAIFTIALLCLRIAVWNGVSYVAYGRETLGVVGAWLIFNLVLMRCLILAGIVTMETTLLINSLGATACLIILLQIYAVVWRLATYEREQKTKGT
jgi:hypothetical protein